MVLQRNLRPRPGHSGRCGWPAGFLPSVRVLPSFWINLTSLGRVGTVCLAYFNKAKHQGHRQSRRASLKNADDALGLSDSLIARTSHGPPTVSGAVVVTLIGERQPTVIASCWLAP